MRKSAKKKQENAEVSPDLGEEIAVTPADATVDTASKKSIGFALLTMREKKELSLDKVAVNLNISERYLQAIEQMEVDELPEKVYTLGFVRSYARYLGVDPQKSVDRFKKEMYDGQAPREIQMPEPLKPIEKPKTALVVATTLIAFGVAAFFYAYETPGKSPSTDQGIHTDNQTSNLSIAPPAAYEFKAEVSPSLSQPFAQELSPTTELNSNANASPAPNQAVAYDSTPAQSGDQKIEQKEQATATPSQTTQQTVLGEAQNNGAVQKSAADATPGTPNSTLNQSIDAPSDAPVVIKANQTVNNSQKLEKLVLNFNDKAWVAIKRSGTVLISKTFTPGESYSFPYSKDLSLSTQNTKAFNVNLEGKEYSLTDRGEKLENFQLKDLTTPPPAPAPEVKPTAIAIEGNGAGDSQTKLAEPSVLE